MNSNVHPIGSPRLNDSERPSGALDECAAVGPIGSHARIVAAARDFQGSVAVVNDEVDVVRTNGHLLPKRDARLTQGIRQRQFVLADAELSRLARLCALLSSGYRISASPARHRGRLDVAPQLWPLFVEQQSSVTSRAHLVTASSPRRIEPGEVNAGFGGQARATLTGQVAGVQRSVVSSHGVSLPNRSLDA